MRRPYPTRSSVHSHPGARTFVKAMLLLARESESLLRDVFPQQYQEQKQLLSNVPAKWRFSELFTSSISNANAAAPFHTDTANIKGTVNVILSKRENAEGGNLFVPDYDATFEQIDGSVLVYPAWRNLHGVTPIEPTAPGGYRNSLIFYPLEAFLKNEVNRY